MTKGQHCPDRRLGGGGFCGGAYALSVSTLEKIFNQSNGSSRHKALGSIHRNSVEFFGRLVQLPERCVNIVCFF